MFVLNKIDSDEEKFVLLPTKNTYTVGRLSTDLVLKEDLSISRLHVRLHLPVANCSQLKLEDLGSKYGTFVNNNIQSNKKMSPNSSALLKVGDKVRFGALKNIWQVTQMKLVTATSALTGVQMKQLEKLIAPMDGLVSASWTDECTYLTMNEVSITLKLLHALLDNKPIVSIAFWQELVSAASRVHVCEGWPKPENFLPSHAADMDIRRRPERTKLFAGKTFVFINRKHVDMYGSIVEKAGGTCKDLNSGVRKTFLTRNNVVVIQYVPSTQSQSTETISNIAEILEKADMRLIPEYEIGMAILHCSMEKYCNPSYKLTLDLLPSTETFTVPDDLTPNSSIVIPNTVENSEQSQPVGGDADVLVPESEVNAASRNSMENSEAGPLKAKAVQQNSQRFKRNRGLAIYVDSSDEESQPAPAKKAAADIVAPQSEVYAINSSCMESIVTEPESVASSKTLKVNSPRLTRKRNIATFVDSEDETDQLAKKLKSSSKASVTIEQEKQNSKTLAHENHKNVQSNELKQLEMNSKPDALQRNTKSASDVDDEALFQFINETPVASKSSNRSDSKPSESNAQSSTKTVDISFDNKKINEPAKINVRNFLEKSQAPVTIEKATEKTTVDAWEQPRKRLHIEVLNESDSDNENLFNFHDVKRSKNTSGITARVSDDEADGLFKFTGTLNNEQRDEEHEEIDSSIAMHTAVHKIDRKSKYVEYKPMQLPRKINVSGWLSSSRLPDVKLEQNVSISVDTVQPDASVKLEEDDEEDNVKPSREQWLASIKDCIQVRMCALSIKSRPLDETHSTDNKYAGRKNFKKFVRKVNPHPQQRVVELKRMKLAEGIVSSF